VTCSFPVETISWTVANTAYGVARATWTDTIKRGEVYAVTDKPNEFWFKIDFKGQPGFVYASSVTFAP